MEPSPELNPAVIEMAQFYPHPPAAVWQALTDPAVLAEWLLPSVGYPAEPGGQFMFLVPTDPPAEIACTITEFDPESRLTWSWVDTRSSVPVPWPVSWTLHPHGRGSRLLLCQSGFDMDDRRQKMARSAMSRFWRTPFAQLGPVLDKL